MPRNSSPTRFRALSRPDRARQLAVGGESGVRSSTFHPRRLRRTVSLGRAPRSGRGVSSVPALPGRVSRLLETATVETIARAPRIEVENGIYHVVARGNERKAIYRDAADRERFLEILCLTVERYGWLALAYCLMGNHYHLLVETPRANLAKGMRQLNGVYAQSFNRRHGRDGHLFQGRYGARLVQADEHLLAVDRKSVV